MLCDAVSTRCMMDADKGMFRGWGFMRDKFMEGKDSDWKKCPEGPDRGANHVSSFNSRRLCFHAHGAVGYVQKAAGF